MRWDFEATAVTVDPLGRGLVRCVHRTGGEVQEERQVWRLLLLVADHGDGLVGEIFGEVVAVLG